MLNAWPSGKLDIMPNAGALRRKEAGAPQGFIPCRNLPLPGSGGRRRRRSGNIHVSISSPARARVQRLVLGAHPGAGDAKFHGIALSSEVFHRCSTWSTHAISSRGSTVCTLGHHPSLPRKLVTHYAVQLSEAAFPGLRFLSSAHDSTSALYDGGGRRRRVAGGVPSAAPQA